MPESAELTWRTDGEQAYRQIIRNIQQMSEINKREMEFEGLFVFEKPRNQYSRWDLLHRAFNNLSNTIWKAKPGFSDNMVCL